MSIAADGLEAVGLIESKQFAAAIMDVWMPRMDGLEAISVIRSRERPGTRGLPIIAVTAHAMAADRDRCLAAGANAYMAKPVNAASLIKLVEELAGIESLGSPHAPPPHPPAEHVGGRETQIFDISSALARLGGDMELFVKLVGFFEEDGPRLFAQVQQGVNQGDAAVVERAAHSLKGLTANFSALAAVEAALRLEDMGHAGDLSLAADAVADLGTQLALLAKALAGFLDPNRGSASQPEWPDSRTGGTNDSVHH